MINKLGLDQNAVSEALSRGELLPELRDELRRSGMSDGEIATKLELHKKLQVKRKRLLKIKWCTVCLRTHCNFRPVSFDVEVEDP